MEAPPGPENTLGQEAEQSSPRGSCTPTRGREPHIPSKGDERMGVAPSNSLDLPHGGEGGTGLKLLPARW